MRTKKIYILAIFLFLVIGITGCQKKDITANDVQKEYKNDHYADLIDSKEALEILKKNLSSIAIT